jgi:hypothetical protein
MLPAYHAISRPPETQQAAHSGAFAPQVAQALRNDAKRLHAGREDSMRDRGRFPTEKTQTAKIFVKRKMRKATSGHHSACFARRRSGVLAAQISAPRDCGFLASIANRLQSANCDLRLPLVSRLVFRATPSVLDARRGAAGLAHATSCTGIKDHGAATHTIVVSCSPALEVTTAVDTRNRRYAIPRSATPATPGRGDFGSRIQTVEHAELRAIVEQHRTLEDVIRFRLPIDVVVQDEFTHDVVVCWRDEIHVVYDTT